MIGQVIWDGMWGVVCLSHLVLLTASFTSLCLMVWLAATPLRSASVQLDAQTWNWDMPETLPTPPVVGEELYLTEKKCHEDVSKHVEEHTPAVAKSLDYSDVSLPSFHPDLPESLMEPEPHVNPM